MRSSVRYAAFIALSIGAAIAAIACINVLWLGSRQIVVAGSIFLLGDVIKLIEGS